MYWYCRCTGAAMRTGRCSRSWLKLVGVWSGRVVGGTLAQQVVVDEVIAVGVGA